MRMNGLNKPNFMWNGIIIPMLLIMVLIMVFTQHKVYLSAHIV